MPIALHIFIRALLWLGFAFLGMLMIPVMDLGQGMAGYAIGGGLVLGLLLSYGFYKAVPARCPNCSANAMYGGNFLGRLRYTCRACGAHRLTTMVTGGSAPHHNIGPWAEGMAGAEQKRADAISRHNAREATRRQQGRKVQYRKHPIAKLWDKLFPPNY